MAEPRGVEERIRWMRANPPGVVGMCARTCWLALGGDYGNPPAWSAADANAVYYKVISSKRFFRTAPPRGALVIWRYGRHGHVAISLGDGLILTTDPSTGMGRVGVESIDYPKKWGATSYIWTDQYNGVRFAVAGPDKEDGMATASEIAEAVWATKTEDPVTGEKVSMRELLKRTRTNAKQAATNTTPKTAE